MIAKRRRLLNFLTKVDKKRSSVIEKKIGFDRAKLGFDKKPLEKVEKAETATKVTKKKPSFAKAPHFAEASRGKSEGQVTKK
jgi:hypothetical protein